MARRVHVFDQPARFVTGTIGQPGNRTFYLQARDGARIVSVSLEKVQVAVLAERLGALLDELERRGIVATRAMPRTPTPEAPAAPAVDSAGDQAPVGSGGSGGSGASAEAGAASHDADTGPEPGTDRDDADDRPLDEPLNEVFRAGTLSLGWDADDERIVIEAREITDEDEGEDPEDAIRESADDDPDGPDLFRVRVEASVARRFVEGAVRVIGAGRPPCPMCGQPLDPQGHLCPRRNGTFLN